MATVFGGSSIPNTTVPPSPGPKDPPRSAPEPRGTGVRVVMQRLAITLPGILTTPYMFQVPPIEELPVQREWSFTDYDTVGAGIHTRPGSSQLKVVAFDSLFVDTDYSFVVNRAAGWNPVAMIDELEKIGEAKTPFQLLVGQPALWGIYYDVNMAATLRSLRSSEKAGERDARYFSISFTQFRGISQADLASGAASGLPAPSAGVTDTAAQSFSTPGRPPLAVLPISSLPKTADTLRDVSKRYYGTHVLWGVIAKASGFGIAGSVSLHDFAEGFRGTPPKVVVPTVERSR